jgi:hypothetical protein
MELKGALPCSQEPTNGKYRNQMNQVYNPQSHLITIHVNIILQSLYGFSKWSLLFNVSYQNFVCTSLPFVLHALLVSSSLIWSF